MYSGISKVLSVFMDNGIKFVEFENEDGSVSKIKYEWGSPELRLLVNNFVKNNRLVSGKKKSLTNVIMYDEGYTSMVVAKIYEMAINMFDSNGYVVRQHLSNLVCNSIDYATEMEVKFNVDIKTSWVLKKMMAEDNKHTYTVKQEHVYGYKRLVKVIYRK